MEIDDLMKVQGKYNAGAKVITDEDHWKTVPRNTAIQVYRHYFVDFGKIEFIFLTINFLQFCLDIHLTMQFDL